VTADGVVLQLPSSARVGVYAIYVFLRRPIGLVRAANRERGQRLYVDTRKRSPATTDRLRRAPSPRQRSRGRSAWNRRRQYPCRVLDAKPYGVTFVVPQGVTGLLGPRQRRSERQRPSVEVLGSRACPDRIIDVVAGYGPTQRSE